MLLKRRDKNIENKNTYIKSPLNYVGGKHKLLPQIIPLFPNKINTFVDLFGGGFNVGINVNANKIVYNDRSTQVSDMLSYFKVTPLDTMLNQIDKMIDEYNLSKENQVGFLELRKRYNSFNPFDDIYDKPLMLYMIICFAFNYQIRFNSKGEYNMPFGKNRSSFNPTLREKFCIFVDKLHQNKMEFKSGDFKDFQTSMLNENDLVYCDPPYFNSTATYNENGGWTEQNENDLRQFLVSLNDTGVKFALSNNLSTNKSLNQWARYYGFKVNLLNGNYNNCNYHKKDRESKDVEVLITNY